MQPLVAIRVLVFLIRCCRYISAYVWFVYAFFSILRVIVVSATDLQKAYPKSLTSRKT